MPYTYTKEEIAAFQAGKLQHRKFAAIDPKTLRDGNGRLLVSLTDAGKICRDEVKEQLLGMDKMYEYIKNHYIGIPRDMLRQAIRGDATMQVHRQPMKKQTQKVIIARNPLQHWQIDITEGGHPITNKDGYFICVVDCYSRFLRAVFKHKKTTTNVVNFLRDIFEKEKPTILQSDNGTEFKSSEMADLCSQHGVKQIFSQPYRPTSQAYIERVQKTLKSIIERHRTDKHPISLIRALEIYNNASHTALKNKTPKQAHEGDIPAATHHRIVEEKKISARHIVAHNADDLEVGDKVRIKLHTDKKDLNYKGYKQQFTTEVYEVERVNRPKAGSTQRISYILDEGDHPYYRYELLKV